MPEPWTGRLIGKMHNNGITYEMLADKVGFKKANVFGAHIAGAKHVVRTAQEHPFR